MARPLFEELPRAQPRHEQVVRRLRVGDHLPSERELCEQPGVGRTIVHATTNDDNRLRISDAAAGPGVCYASWMPGDSASWMSQSPALYPFQRG